MAGMERLVESGLQCLFGSRIMGMFYDHFFSLEGSFWWSSGTAAVLGISGTVS
jgi:hypothetical protein